METCEFIRKMRFEGGEHLVDDVVGPREALLGFLRLHESFCGEEVGIDEAGEKVTKYECHRIIACVGAGERG